MIMNTISIKIEDELKRQVEEKAKELQINTNDLIVKALNEFLYLARVNQLRDDLTDYAKKQGFESEEDIFREIS